MELLHDSVTRGWVIVTGGSLARLAIGFLPSVLIARAFGPAELGVYALLAAVASVMGAVCDLGLTEAAVRRIAPAWLGAPTVARERARGYFWDRLIATAIIVTAGLLLIVPIGSRWHAIDYQAGLLALALLGVIATALCGAVNGILQATGHFGRLSLVLISNSVLTACLALSLWVTGYLTIATVLVFLGIGTSVVSFVVGRQLLPKSIDLALPARAALIQESRTLFSFGVWVWIANAFATVTAQLDLLLAGHWLSAVDVGGYALAVSLAAKASVVNHSLHTALLPAVSSLDSPASIRTYLRRGLLRSVVVGLCLAALIPLSHPLIALFFGGAFGLSAALFPALLGVIILDIFAAPVLLLAYRADRPQILAAADGLRCATLLVVATWLVPGYGPYGLVLAKLAATVAGLALTVILLARGRSRLGWLEAEVAD